MNKKYKITIIEGPHFKTVRRNAIEHVIGIIKKQIDEVGEAEFRRKVVNQ